MTFPGGGTETFAASGRMKALVDRDGNETSLSYDEAGRLERVTDPSGRSLTFRYDAEGQVEAVEEPLGGIVQYGYEGGELDSVTLPGESTPRWHFSYDADHRFDRT